MNAERNLSVDAFKLVAAFGVVVIHLSPSTGAAEAFTQFFVQFAVPFFLLISLHFFIKRISPLPAPRFSNLRLDRIVVPYVVWTVIYTLMRLLKFRLSGKPFEIDAICFTLFGGAAVQLYFLPLLVLFQAQALAVILWFRAPKWKLAGAGVALGAVGFGYLGSARGYFGFQGPLELGVAYVALAFILCFVQATAIGRRMNLVVGYLILPLLGLTIFGHDPLSTLGRLQGPIVGYAVSALALNLAFHTTTPALRALLTCSYGIYLAHFGFLESLEFSADKLSLSLIPYSVPGKILFASLICLCCVAFIVIARRHWLSSYLFLGELANSMPGRTGPAASRATSGIHR